MMYFYINEHNVLRHGISPERLPLQVKHGSAFIMATSIQLQVTPIPPLFTF